MREMINFFTKKRRSLPVAVAVFCLPFAVSVAFGCGYVMNLVKLTKCDFVAPYKAEALRAVGVIPPVGAIMGYLTIEDGEVVEKKE